MDTETHFCPGDGAGAHARALGSDPRWELDDDDRYDAYDRERLSQNQRLQTVAVIQRWRDAKALSAST